MADMPRNTRLSGIVILLLASPHVAVATASVAPPPPPTPADTPLLFSAGFSDGSVLQRSATTGAAIYGFAPTSALVTVTVSGSASYTVHAEVSVWGGPYYHPATGPEPTHGAYVWSAVLHPQNTAGGQYTITVEDGQFNHTATIRDVTYGDVWFCSVRKTFCTL